MKFQSATEAFNLYCSTVSSMDKKLQARPKDIRVGQCYFMEFFNAFKDYDEDNFINYTIVGNNDIDCFYNDDNVKNFLTAIYTYFVINFDEYSRK